MIPSVIGAVVLGSNRVKASVARDRLLACHACPLFYEPLRTCGTPRLGPDGCWCHMPTKASTVANCWAFDKGRPYGWPPSLNSVINEEYNEQIEAD